MVGDDIAGVGQQEQSPLFPKTMALVSSPDGVEKLARAIVTHHPKIPRASVPDTQAICHRSAMSEQLANAVGVCSATIRSDHPFSTATGAADSPFAKELYGDPKTSSPSLFELMRSRDDQPLRKAGLTDEMITTLRAIFQSNSDRVPDTVSRNQTQVYFEAGDDCILVTPVYPVKFAHELNRRLQERKDAYSAWQKLPETTASETAGTDQPIPPKPPHNGLFPVGGTKPQNVGQIVGGRRTVTRHGGFPILYVRQPQEATSADTLLLRRLRASARYVAIAELTKERLLDYGWRAVRAIDLASHRKAEAAQADDIANEYLEMCRKLSPLLQAWPADFWDQGGWSQISASERALLDPRKGQPDVAQLAGDYARDVASRIIRALAEHTYEKAGDDRESGLPPQHLPPRSYQALEDAFVIALKIEVG